MSQYFIGLLKFMQILILRLSITFYRQTLPLLCFIAVAFFCYSVIPYGFDRN